MLLSKKLYTAAQVREFDRLTIEDHAVPGIALMELAGKKVFDVIRRDWPKAIRITVLCGVGNNAGDGYVVARLATEMGLPVQVIALGDVNKLSGDALTAYERFVEVSGSIITDIDLVSHKPDLFVDALLGTGIEREVAGTWYDCIEKLNALSIPVCAIDIPSGLHANTGATMGIAVEADFTISFIALKRGLYTANGLFHCGELFFDNLDVPEEVYRGVPWVEIIDEEWVVPFLHARALEDHKGDFGHSLLIGGDYGYAGAIALASEAAARVGSGLTSVVTRAEHSTALVTRNPEVMCLGVSSASEMTALVEKASVIAIGPGLAQQQWGKALLAAVIDCSQPLVVDADALNLLAKEPVSRGNWVLTPHPGEAARLLACSVADVQQDRFYAVEQIQSQYGGVCVLKGAASLVADDQQIYINTSGNPGMASGGMGDVLTGMITGFIAQGFSLSDAANCAVYLHGAAGDRAALEGERGLLARDLLAQLRLLVNIE